MRRVPGPLDLDGNAVDAVPAELFGGAAERVADGARDLVPEERAHARESGTVSVGAPMSPLGSCAAKSRQVRTAASPYAATSVRMLTVKPSGPSRARSAPERIAPAAFAALHASAKTAFAPARSAGVNEESWNAFTVPLAPNIRKCRVASVPTAIGSAPEIGRAHV